MPACLRAAIEQQECYVRCRPFVLFPANCSNVSLKFVTGFFVKTACLNSEIELRDRKVYRSGFERRTMVLTRRKPLVFLLSAIRAGRIDMIRKQVRGGLIHPFKDNNILEFILMRLRALEELGVPTRSCGWNQLQVGGLGRVSWKSHRARLASLQVMIDQREIITAVPTPRQRRECAKTRMSPSYRVFAKSDQVPEDLGWLE